jgi:hypothetical protein
MINKSEYHYSEKCRNAIASQLKRRAGDFVTDDMIQCARKLDEVHADFRNMVQDAAAKLLQEH